MRPMSASTAGSLTLVYIIALLAPLAAHAQTDLPPVSIPPTDTPTDPPTTTAQPTDTGTPPPATTAPTSTNDPPSNSQPTTTGQPTTQNAPSTNPPSTNAAPTTNNNNPTSAGQGTTTQAAPGTTTNQATVAASTTNAAQTSRGGVATATSIVLTTAKPDQTTPLPTAVSTSTWADGSIHTYYPVKPGFFQNKGAVAGVFTPVVLALIFLSAFGVSWVKRIRRRTRRRRARRERYEESFVEKGRSARSSRAPTDQDHDVELDTPAHTLGTPALMSQADSEYVMQPATADAYPDRQIHYGPMGGSQQQQQQQQYQQQQHHRQQQQYQQQQYQQQQHQQQQAHGRHEAYQNDQEHSLGYALEQPEDDFVDPYYYPDGTASAAPAPAAARPAQRIQPRTYAAYGTVQSLSEAQGGGTRSPR